MKKESLSVRFLYGTVVGRFFLKGLVSTPVSKFVGVILSSPLSAIAVSRFIKKHNIDMTEYEKRKYRSFNDFFTRKRISVNIPDVRGKLISPCDSYLSIYKIDSDRVFDIKKTTYSIEQLLEDNNLSEQYKNGFCLIFRLTPQHYHRYCYACSGKKIVHKRIKGKLHCVRPIAYTKIPVFTQNSREYICVENKHFGNVTQMEIGALLVGKIINHDNISDAVKGKEKGYFAFGGSTIVLLLEEGKIDLVNKYSDIICSGSEVSIRMGDVIGSAS